MIYSIKSPETLKITDSDGRVYFGAQQDWYADEWQRRAGCGPTTASHILWYLSRTREGVAALAPYDGGTKEGFLALMEGIWNYVTPGSRGLNHPDMMKKGVAEYSAKIGVPLTCRAILIPAFQDIGDLKDEVYAFLRDALSADQPVAFLNLSNGKLENLHNWHWVTLVSFDDDRKTAVMYDDGAATEIDMELWLDTTLLGGGLVAVEARAMQKS